MNNKLLLIIQKLGINGAIVFTSFTRIIQALGGIISVLLVANFLSPIEQGFYYTFASILAIQVFFELGLNGIITQFVAYEVAPLKQIENCYEGSYSAKSRLTSILHFTVKWFSILSFFVFVLLLLLGFLFFTHYFRSNQFINWHVPWILLSIGTTLNFLLSPIIAFIEGLGKIKEIAKIRLIQQLFGLVILWAGLIGGIKLYVGGISMIFTFLIILFLLRKYFWITLKNIYNQEVTTRVSYRMEILPLQWKIALSWVGGYFIFQFFNPVLFATEGPEIAGQMGMTLSVLNAILALSFAWISTKIPVFSGLISKHEFQQLDQVFNQAFKQSVFIHLFAIVSFLIVILFLRYFNVEFAGKNIGDNFLSFMPLTFMMSSFFMNHLIGSWAVYLRAHKKEPLLIHSIVYGFLSCLSTVFLGKYYGIEGLTTGYFIIVLFATIWAYDIFKSKRNLWHNEQ